MKADAQKTRFTSPVSVVLLAYNEAQVIEPVIRGVLDGVVEKFPGSELIIAEDGSTDGTETIVRRLAAEHPAIRLIQGSRRKGYLRAFRETMLSAKNELILFCDASGKYDFDDFRRMLPLMESSDMVVGYKRERQDPLYRVWMSRIFNGLARLYFGIALHDANCPFRLMRRQAFEAIAKENWILRDLVSFEVSVRMIARGFRVAEMDIRHFPRASGASRGLPPKKIPSAIWNTISNFPRLKREITAEGYRRGR